MADNPNVVTQNGEDSHQGWRMMLKEIMDNIHDRITYTTKERKDALEDASRDPYEVKEPDEPKGFKKVKEHAK